MNGLHDVSVAIGALRAQGEERGRQLAELVADVKSIKTGIDIFRDAHDKRIGAIEDTITEARGIKKGVIVVVAFVSSAVTIAGSQFPKLLTLIGVAK